jgi:hypothetical protein
MMTDRFQAVVDTAAQLPPEVQDELAAALEETLKRITQPVPPMAPGVRVVFEQVVRDHAADLAYLKDK